MQSDFTCYLGLMLENSPQLEQILPFRLKLVIGNIDLIFKVWFTLRCKSAATCHRRLWVRKFSNYLLQPAMAYPQMQQPATSVNEP